MGINCKKYTGKTRSIFRRIDNLNEKERKELKRGKKDEKSDK